MYMGGDRKKEKRFVGQRVVYDDGIKAYKTKCLRGFNCCLRGGAVVARLVGGTDTFGLHEVYMELRSGKVREWQRFVLLFLCLVFDKLNIKYILYNNYMVYLQAKMVIIWQRLYMCI